jgi:type II secretory pathway pseudopilin PulG
MSRVRSPVVKLSIVRNMKKWLHTNQSSGFTLIEVLIFITIVSMLFVVAVSLATSSLRTIKSNENRTYATYYSESLQEWLRSEKEVDWEQFVGRIPSDPTVYCFNADLPNDSVWPSQGACSGYGLDSRFKREVSLRLQTVGSTQQVLVEVETAWQEGANTSDVSLKTILTPSQL